MKTIEELEARLETVTRERDLSLSAWEAAGMQGRTAQKAMLKLTRQLEEAQERIELLTELREEERSLNAHFHNEIQAKHTAAEQAKRERDEARETIVALTTAMAEKDLEIATIITALDERDLEAERGLEQYDRLMRQLADATNESTHFQVMCKRETEEVERLQVACHAWAEDMREAARLCEQAGNEMPIDAVRRFVSSKTAIVDMLQDRLSEARSEVDRLTDERDELLVRVANQDAELRATREAYRDAYRRGAEAMRGECIGAACGFFMGTTGFCNGDEDELEAVLEALPIPEEP